jgi:hypothetical protein
MDASKTERHASNPRRATTYVVTNKVKLVGKLGWLAKPEEHDFLAAADYLSLVFPGPACEAIVKRLRDAPVLQRKAKDLIRASRLELLTVDDSEVRKDLKRVADGKKLSPVLLVRGVGSTAVPLIVADGYHRICASYHIDEDSVVDCFLVDSGWSGSEASPHGGLTRVSTDAHLDTTGAARAR